MILKNIKRNVKSFLNKNQLINNLILKNDKRKIYKKLKGKVPIFVYQMGKVASSSVFYSLQDYYNNNGTLFHAHHFESPHSYNPWIGLFYDFYNEKKPPIKIITLVREPIGVNISQFFQDIKYYADVKKIKENSYSDIELQEIFLSKSDHNRPLNWFDDELKNNFNIDVYKYDFPKDNYQIIKNDDVELLIMKHDLADKNKEKAIMEFLSIKGFKLNTTNVSSDKFYKKAYKGMKELSYPKWYVDKMLNSRYVNHFYKNDIEMLREKWLKKN